MFQFIPRQVMARRMVPLTVRGIPVAPRLTPLHRQTSLRFYSDKKDSEKLSQDTAKEAPDSKLNREDEILELRQKLYRTNTWHEAEQLRKQLRQHGEEVSELSPTATFVAKDGEFSQQQQHSQPNEEQPALEGEPLKENQTAFQSTPIEEDLTLTLQNAQESILKIRTLITDLDERSHYFGEYEPSYKVAEANTQLSKIEVVLENFRHVYQEQDFARQDDEAVAKGEMTRNETKIFRWLQRMEAEKADLVMALVETKGSVKMIGELVRAAERRLEEMKRRRAWASILVIAGAAGLWLLPAERREWYFAILKGEWEYLRKWVDGIVDGRKKKTAATTAEGEEEVVVKERAKPTGEVIVYSSSSSLRRLDDQQRLSRLSQFFLVLFWFLCWVGRFPRITLPGRVR